MQDENGLTPETHMNRRWYDKFVGLGGRMLGGGDFGSETSPQLLAFAPSPPAPCALDERVQKQRKCKGNTKEMQMNTAGGEILKSCQGRYKGSTSKYGWIWHL